MQLLYNHYLLTYPVLLDIQVSVLLNDAMVTIKCGYLSTFVIISLGFIPARVKKDEQMKQLMF